MVTQFVSENPLLGAYCKQEHIVVQFILSEFLDAYQYINQLERLSDELGQSETKPAQKRVDALIHQIAINLEALFFESDWIIAPWNVQHGILNRLGKYARAYGVFDQEYSAHLIAVIEKTQHCCLEAYKSIKVKNTQNIHLLLKRIALQMQKIANHINKLIEKHEDNESILLFLLRHYEKFQITPKAKRIHQLMRLTSSQSLMDKFRHRGFINILPFIKNKLPTVIAKKK